MDKNNTNKKLIHALKKELESANRKEAQLHRQAGKSESFYKDWVQEKVPKGLYDTLQRAFSKAFYAVFKNGIGIIEQSYDKEELAADYDVRNFAIDRKGSRREMRKLKHSAARSDFLNMSITTVEGVGLGAFGIGLPDIVLFIGMILKGIYEVSLHYGYDYDSNMEKYLILKMMGTALSKGDKWEEGNREIDEIFQAPFSVDEEMLQREIEYTSQIFATDMITLKFIQGIPIVGIIGGVFNPIYYHKILNYVKVKYYKRFLNDKLMTCDME